MVEKGLTNVFIILFQIITPDAEYPMVCVDVRKDGDSNNLKLDLVSESIST